MTMSSSQYKYSAVMATETGQLVEGKTAKEEEASIIQDMTSFDYGAPVPVSRPSNYKDRLLLATACCCCCGLAAVKCSHEVNHKLRAGDMEGAKIASDKTLRWTNMAVLTGLSVGAVLVIMLAVALLLLIFIGIDAPKYYLKA